MSPKSRSKKAPESTELIRQALKDVMPSLEDKVEALAALDALEAEIAEQRAALQADST